MSDGEPARYVVTAEPDIDTDPVVAHWRAKAGAYGVRPHPDDAAAMHAQTDSMRGIIPDEQLVEDEKLLVAVLQLQAIEAYAGGFEFHRDR
ncbi:hypothetical protein GCM10009676_34620 [Prauserella halophila]|uniref:Uncharacterized protein n=1 Tax=Prauserella halophila TaxID=185641 RepID=A0ABN1WGD5_9PSEU|nr:hypothetical protein [Prauserella halophila]MCP2238424.1 hypothetical protein [Prauserella halophila]